MAKKQYVIEQIENGGYLVGEVRRQGSGWYCHQPIALSSLAGSLKGEATLVIRSASGLVVTDEFPSLGRELLLLQMTKRLDQLALLDVGDKGAICYRALEQRNTKHLYTMVVVPQKTLSDGLTAIVDQGRLPLKICTAAAAAIAALLGRLSVEPWIVVFVSEFHAEIIATRNGLAIYQQRLQVNTDNEVETSMLPHAINFCRQSLRRDFAIDSAQLIGLGPGRDQLRASPLAAELVEPDLATAGFSGPADLLRYPELFGALFVDRDFCFLPAEYKKSLTIGRLSKGLAIAAGCAALILGGLSWQNHVNNDQLAASLISRHQQLATDLARIKAQLPAVEAVKQQEVYGKILEKGKNEPRLTAILADIASQLPPQVKVESFAVERRVRIAPQVPMTVLPDPATQTMPADQAPLAPLAPLPSIGSQAPQEPLAGPQAVVESGPENELDKEMVLLLAVGTSGAYERVRATFGQVVNDLATRFRLEEIDWNYTENDDSGRLKCELHLLENGHR